MRVYIPFTVDRLADVQATSRIGPVPFEACAVTTARRREQPELDDEQLEYEATVDAARRSLELLAQDPASAYRRLVVVADISDGQWARSESPGWVSVTQEVPLSLVAAFLVDGRDAEPDISTAALTMAYDVVDIPLQWFAAGELATLVSTADA